MSSDSTSANQEHTTTTTTGDTTPIQSAEVRTPTTTSSNPNPPLLPSRPRRMTSGDCNNAIGSLDAAGSAVDATSGGATPPAKRHTADGKTFLSPSSFQAIKAETEDMLAAQTQALRDLKDRFNQDMTKQQQQHQQQLAVAVPDVGGKTAPGPDSGDKEATKSFV
ncbi:uncharacterized protein PG986_012640 [Apiospora aurea]|uniref:EKC/KEOPS complex subunit GON7 n=1 Tax=Apiospora aurea TaxID=335848 RepID=A0ABR1Q0L2_9PEZI